MLKIIAKLTLKEGKVDEFNTAASTVISETRKEAGNISYQLFQDVNNSKVFTFVEEWQDQEAIQLHMKAAHFQAFSAQAKPLLEKDMEVNIYRLVI